MPAAGTGVNPAWMSAGIQADLTTIKADFTKIRTDLAQLNQDVNAKNVNAANDDASKVALDGTGLSSDAFAASNNASLDGGVPAAFQTAMTDFSDAGAAIKTLDLDLLSGDQVAVNADICKLNTSARQGQTALIAAEK